jgi:hypothetical protein
MTILMKKPGAIQTRQTHHGPVVQRREDPLVDPRVPEQGEEACQCRRLATWLMASSRPGSQVSHLPKLLGATQDPCHKPGANLMSRYWRAARFGCCLLAALRQQILQQFSEAIPVQETSETPQPCTTADFLVRETDSDRLGSRPQFNKFQILASKKMLYKEGLTCLVRLCICIDPRLEMRA